MKFHPEKLYHVYNRGNNSQFIFYSSENYFFFLKKMRILLIPNVKMLAYCLMPNHFHWLIWVKPVEKTCLNKNIGTLLSSYTQAINKRYGRTGSLFQQKTKAIELANRNYAQTCFHYIHQNPIRANLVKNMEDWPFSSYIDYANLRDGSLISKEFTHKYLEITEKQFIQESQQAIDPQNIKHIY
ncbi:transposase [Fodinibius sp.]|uniref:transposase n=1 Tax=Fodinibius sp. TaxID=1872440 RepID=UPI002ACE0F90|nr:transposase [Fodinibius sp.]MDZ7659095.1 hypothetical protein [Fodinibius sp.]